MENQDKDNIKFYKITFFDFQNERAKYLINKWIIRSTATVENEVVRMSLLNINGKDMVNDLALWKIALIE
jgi:hypothetical protein